MKKRTVRKTITENKEPTLKLYPSTINYADGSEQQLLELFSNSNYDEFTSWQGQGGWAQFYHLSPSRQNLLNWINYGDSPQRILELGAGCGALTSFFTRLNNVKVTAVEGALSRAQIIQKRCKNADNLDIHACNIRDFKPDGKYDIVTLIGVLEYAGAYDKSPDPFHEMLVFANQLLDKDGYLLIAIENQIGHKYLAGYPEDHYGCAFEGINGYPRYSGKRTFDAETLRNKLRKAGFSHQRWFYPYPDYKVPSVVFSEGALDRKDFDFLPLMTLPTTDYSTRVQPTFNERTFIHSLKNIGQVSPFMNSFLVVAAKSKKARFFSLNDDMVAVKANAENRAPQFRTFTYFMADDSSNIFVKRQRIHPGKVKHFRNGKHVLNASSQEYHSHHINLSDAILDAILNRDYELACKHITTWHKKLDAISKAPSEDSKSVFDEFSTRHLGRKIYSRDNINRWVSGKYMDVHPGNILLPPNTDNVKLIDMEWQLSFKVPVQLLFDRGLVILANTIRRYAKFIPTGFHPQTFLPIEIHNALSNLPLIRNSDIKSCSIFDDWFQSAVRKGDFDKANGESLSSENRPDATDIKTGLASSIIKRGNTLMEIGRLDAAIKEFEKLVIMHPDYPDGYVSLGNCYLEMNAYDAALLGYQKALELSPNHDGAKRGIALIESKQKNEKKQIPLTATQKVTTRKSTKNATKNPKCSIIIPTYNKVEYTKQCLASLLENTDSEDCEIIVVDNASTDGTRDFLKTFNGRINLITNKNNLGFAKACNQGAKAAKGQYILFLNNDTTPHPHWLDSLLQMADADEKLGVLGSKLLYPNGTIQHAGVVAGLRDGETYPYHIYLCQPADAPCVNKPREYQMVTGACLMIRRTIFERLDGFDESFVNGHEDMDLCLRVRQMGYKVMYCPESVITHFEARTKRLIGLDNFHYKKGVNNEEGRGRRRFLEKWQDVLEIDDQNYYIEDGVVKQARVTPKSYTKSGDSFNILFTMYGWSETGGGTTYPRSIAKELVKRGHKVSVFYASLKADASKPPYSILKEVDDGVTLYGIYNRPALFIDPDNPEREIRDEGIVENFRAVLNEVRPDVVHFHNFHGLTFAMAKETKSRGISACYTPHNYHMIDPNLYLFNSDLSLWKDTDLLKNSEAVKKNPDKIRWYKGRTHTTRILLNEWVDITLAVSSRQKELLVHHGARPERVAVVHQSNSSTDTLWNSPLLSQEGARPLHNPLHMGFIGGVMPHKGVHMIVAAAQAFNPSDVEIHIYGFAGGKYLEQLRAIDKKNMVKFHGEYRQEQLELIAHELDISIVPSIWEDCAPLVLLELMAMRLPVIAANIGGIPDFIEDGINGFLYKYDSIESLQESIAYCINNREKVQTMRTALRQPHSLSRYMDHLEKIYLALHKKTLSEAHNYELFIDVGKGAALEKPTPATHTSEVIKEPTSVGRKTQFEGELRKLFGKIRPSKIIETGTHQGRGTSTIIWEAIKDFSLHADFTTIEINPYHYDKAVKYFKKNEMNIQAELGLSIPRTLLPSKEEISDKFVRNKEINIHYDHSEEIRASQYFAETNINVPVNMLYHAMRRYDFSPDFVLLDSGGHIGLVEFEYFMKLIKGDCYLMLDDTHHCKHYKTLQAIKANPRFEILVESPEKFGFCIAKYTHVESPLNNRQPVQMLNDGQQPAVSVVIPCYNHAGFLAKAVESVVNQTFTDWECIIVNDGSHDDTAQVAESLTWKYLDKKINIITQANHGLPTARNAGIKASKGRYILPLDADDLIHPEMLQKTVSLLDTHPEIAIAYTDIKQIGSVNRIVYTGEYNFRQLRFQDLFSYCSLYRRKAWESAGGYNPKMVLGYADWDFWIACGEKGHYGQRIPEPLFMYRVKDNSMHTDALEHHGELMAQIVQNHPGLYYQKDIVPSNSKNLAQRYFDNKDYDKAISTCEAALLKDFTDTDALTLLNNCYHEMNTDDVKQGEALYRPQPTTPLSSGRNSGAIGVVWEGSQFVYHSLALINRELCLSLVNAGCDISILPYEQDQFRPEQDSPFLKIAEREHKPLSKVNVHVRHHWPPNFNPPRSGHWVNIQPWEYGCLPKAWIEPMQNLIDELWVPSNYVRRCYIESGISPEKVFVVPNGVNADTFSPQAQPEVLNTKKSFKFLFVGGSIWRKGIDILLESYVRSFTSKDDVCLVIKEMGQNSFYKGQDASKVIGAIQASPNTPEILYITEDIPAGRIAGLYTACDCLVHPYRGEGFGLPVAEAMACGLPVIVTEGGATDDFCTSETVYQIPAKLLYFNKKDYAGDQGWVLDPDRIALSKQMKHVFENRDEARLKGLQASKHIRKNFTWQKAADMIIERLAKLQRKPILRCSDITNNPVRVGKTPKIPYKQKKSKRKKVILGHA